MAKAKGLTAELDKYSILSYLSTFSRSGYYTLRIQWPGYSLKNIWKQTSNPTTSTVSGYSPISIGSTTNYWGGLEYNGVSALMDGSVNHTNWYYAIGSKNVWWGGVPAADAVAGGGVGVPEVELWVQ